MTELDSFFARRDRKKACGRRHLSSLSGAIVKPSGPNNIPPVGKLNEGDGIHDPSLKSRTDQPGPDDEEDDEWRSVESEKKDYTGLKIQPLITPETEETENEVEDGKTTSTVPWKIADISTAEGNPSDGNALNSSSESVQAALQNPHNPGVYVNPRERMIAKKLLTPTLMTSCSAPPDVKSTVVFPSLLQVEKTGGLRSNQSVWNKSTAGIELRTRNFQTVEACVKSEIRNSTGRAERDSDDSGKVNKPWRQLISRVVQEYNDTRKEHGGEDNHKKFRGRINYGETEENWRTNTENNNRMNREGKKKENKDRGISGGKTQENWRTQKEIYNIHVDQVKDEKSISRINKSKTLENWRNKNGSNYKTVDYVAYDKSIRINNSKNIENRRADNEIHEIIKGNAWSSKTKDNVISREKSDSSVSNNPKFPAGLSIPLSAPPEDSTKPRKYLPPNMRNKLTTGNNN